MDMLTVKYIWALTHASPRGTNARRRACKHKYMSFHSNPLSDTQHLDTKLNTSISIVHTKQYLDKPPEARKWPPGRPPEQPIRVP